MRFKALEAEKLLDMEGPCRPLQVSGGPRPWQEGPGGFWKVVEVSSKVLPKRLEAPGPLGALGGAPGGPWPLEARLRRALQKKFKSRKR